VYSLINRDSVLWQLKRRSPQRWLLFALSLLCALLFALAPQTQMMAQSSPPDELAALLPEPSVHPLPDTLAQWQDSEHVGDYFDAITPTPVGYLIWSDFPIQVYVDMGDVNPTETERAEAWLTAVETAIAEWNTYLPLTEGDDPEQADILIYRETPPLQQEPGQPLRARSAATRYEIYAQATEEGTRLAHRFTMHLSPSQTADYTLATARHEVGHALGIWGHSPLETDALYFSQVRTPPSISARDVNTLKKIYEQPTRLGWLLPDAATEGQ
jgi:predicted Zn-dependent protease